MENETQLTNETQAKLLVVFDKSGLEPESKQYLRDAFAPLFEQAEQWRQKAIGLKVTDASQTREMKLCRESRLALKEIRCSAENVRKKLKADILQRGRAVDGIYNVLEMLVEPLENYLLDQEKFVERLEEARLAKIKQAREEEIRPYVDDVTLYSVADMTEQAFIILRDGLKSAKEAKAAAEAKAREEADRIMREKAAEDERIRKENEALKASLVHAQKLKEEADAVIRRKQEEEERARMEEARKAQAPDKEKLLYFATHIDDNFPEVVSPAAVELRNQMARELAALAASFVVRINRL